MMANGSCGFREMLAEARKRHYAVGAFNIFSYLSARAVVEAAMEARSPVILQTSAGTVQSIGPQRLFRMIRAAGRDADVPVLLHLDHCRDLSLLCECVDAGWDSVMIDASARPFEENVALTSKARAYASARGVAVEAELGVITGVEEDIVAGREIGTDYDEAMLFLEKTKVDAFAPAIGTAHGIYRGPVNLNYDLLRRLAEGTDIPIVVHGGTGLSPEQFARLVRSGAAKINISTALKHAYIDSAREYLTSSPDRYVPLELDKAVCGGMKDVAKEHMTFFSSDGKCAKGA